MHSQYETTALVYERFPMLQTVASLSRTSDRSYSIKVDSFLISSSDSSVTTRYRRLVNSASYGRNHWEGGGGGPDHQKFGSSWTPTFHLAFWWRSGGGR